VSQTVGIDLPLKALAWEDAEGQVWLTYNEIPWLIGRHNLGAGTSAAATALDAGQVSVLLATTAPSPPEAVD
jgi:uncharacterized protein (DUF302 family)